MLAAADALDDNTGDTGGAMVTFFLACDLLADCGAAAFTGVFLEGLGAGGGASSSSSDSDSDSDSGCFFALREDAGVGLAFFAGVVVPFTGEALAADFWESAHSRACARSSAAVSFLADLAGVALAFFDADCGAGLREARFLLASWKSLASARSSATVSFFLLGVS